MKSLKQIVMWFVVVLLAFTTNTWATTKDWNADMAHWSNGSWSNGSFWSPGGVPGADDHVNIGPFGDGDSRTITYDYTGAPVTLRTLSLDLTGPGAETVNFDMSANNLTSEVEKVGEYGRGTFNQGGGTHTIVADGYLAVGDYVDSSGTYNLSGTGALVSNGSEFIGVEGTGVFNQTGGSNTIVAGASYYFDLGFHTDSTGIYNLSGTGALVSNANEYIGYFGTGVFNQTGGTNTLATGRYLHLGYDAAGMGGTYNLSGGSLTSTYEYVGSGGSGTFEHSGGTNTIAAGAGYLSVGTYAGSTGTYNLSSTGVLVSNSDEYVGNIGTGVFNQTGGTNTLSADKKLYLGYNALGGEGTYNLSGGDLTSTYEYVGTYNSGTFEQTGGTNTIAAGAGYLDVGVYAGSSGTYNLSGTGALVSNVNEYVGDIGTGVFHQTGGTNTIAENSSLFLGYNAAGGGGTYLLDSGDLSAGGEFIGVNSTGTFTQTGGSNTSLSAKLGYDSDVTGTATITGPSTTWLNTNSMTVGQFGDGALNIENGASVSCTVAWIAYGSDSNSHVSVTGAGSSLTDNEDLSVGESGDGTLMIEDGGSVSSFNGLIGRQTGSNGHVFVQGAGSSWINSKNLYVGVRSINDPVGGAGSLQISDGGVVQAASLRVADTSYVEVNNGTAEVAGLILSGGVPPLDGEGYWGSLFVANISDGRMDISGGGVAYSAYARIGSSPEVTGRVTVTGAESKWINSDDLFVANLGTGFLEISDGGAVYNLKGQVGNNADSSGTVIVTDAGSIWRGTGSFYIGKNGNGALSVLNGGMASTDGESYLGIFAGGSGTATVSGAGSVWHTSSTLAIGGGLFAAGGTGDLMIDSGGVVDANAVILYDTGLLTFGLSGTNDNGHISTNSATLNGSLDVQLLNSFQLGSNQEFTILDVANTLSGQFDGLGEGALVGNFGGTDLFITYASGNGHDVALYTLAAGLPGDFDHDGDVDGNDFLVWQRDTNVGSLADWQAHYGTPLTSTANAVPEPTSLFLFLLGFTSIINLRTSRESHQQV